MSKMNNPGTSNLRNAVLKKMGPMDEKFYPEGAAVLLDSYIAQLRADWERGALWEIEDRFKVAVRTALGGNLSG